MCIYIVCVHVHTYVTKKNAPKIILTVLIPTW